MTTAMITAISSYETIRGKLDAIVWNSDVADAYSAALDVFAEICWWEWPFLVSKIRKWAENQSDEYQAKCDTLADRRNTPGVGSIYSHYAKIRNRYGCVHAATNHTTR